MPSLRNSLVQLKGYSPIKVGTPIERAQPVTLRPQPVSSPALPPTLARSSVMISSLPSISTNVDGILRQFYGGRSLPMRRLILP